MVEGPVVNSLGLAGTWSVCAEGSLGLCGSEVLARKSPAPDNVRSTSLLEAVSARDLVEAGLSRELCRSGKSLEYTTSPVCTRSALAGLSRPAEPLRCVPKKRKACVDFGCMVSNEDFAVESALAEFSNVIRVMLGS